MITYIVLSRGRCVYQEHIYIFQCVFVITLRIEFVSYGPKQFNIDAVGVQDGVCIIIQYENNVKMSIA